MSQQYEQACAIIMADPHGGERYFIMRDLERALLSTGVPHSRIGDAMRNIEDERDPALECDMWNRARMKSLFSGEYIPVFVEALAEVG